MTKGWTNSLTSGAGAALLAALIGWATAQAEPTERGEIKTVRGKVMSFTTAPKGEVDGAILEGDIVIHWPPHLEERFKGIIDKGDRVEATGLMETGPQGDKHLEVRTLTNLRTKVSHDSDDAPPPPPKGPPPRGKDKDAPPPPPSAENEPAKTVKGTVKEFTKAPRGEVDGLMLTDGTWVHWPPHLQERFKDIVAKGDRVQAVGQMETGPRGDDPHLEISSLTNLRTGVMRTNPDRPQAVADRAAPGNAKSLEERVQALEDKIDQLTREIDRPQRKK